MKNSCIVLLTAAGIDIGDTHYIWGQNGVNRYYPEAIFLPGKLHCLGTILYHVIIFLYERVLIIHMAYQVFQEHIILVSLCIWPFVSLLVHPSVHPFVNFKIKVLL